MDLANLSFFTVKIIYIPYDYKWSYGAEYRFNVGFVLPFIQFYGLLVVAAGQPST